MLEAAPLSNAAYHAALRAKAAEPRRRLEKSMPAKATARRSTPSALSANRSATSTAFPQPSWGSSAQIRRTQAQAKRRHRRSSALPQLWRKPIIGPGSLQDSHWSSVIGCVLTIYPEEGLRPNIREHVPGHADDNGRGGLVRGTRLLRGPGRGRGGGRSLAGHRWLGQARTRGA